ncbi:MAG: methylamine dehydrogenase accessory protein MauD [Zoogloeaceae bacterium]|jgi:methylamine dehydrogenase accessory protein MauD|nr:methylamine dehydrogenase accessory protein MauD [Zoogloeaceae bacterium]
MTNFLVFAVIVLWVLVLALMVIVLAMARQIGVLLERVSPVGAMVNDTGPLLGEASPVFDLPDLNGGGNVRLGVPQLRHQLVFFLSPTCPICKTLLPALKSIRGSEGNWLDVILASDGEAARHRRFIEQMNLGMFPYLLSGELGMRCRVSKLPFAMLLDPQGVVRGKGLINSREQLESLFNALESGHASIQEYMGLTSASQPV